MSAAPTTKEGHYALHFVYDVDWDGIEALEAAERAGIIDEAKTFLTAANEGAGGSALYSLVGGKGDVLAFHLRATIDEVHQAELDFSRLGLHDYLTVTYSYVSVAELASHGDPTQRRIGMLKKRGIEEGSDEWNDAMEALLEEAAAFEDRRLRPPVRDERYFCFYPMSKRRGEQVNWYNLTNEERGALMRDHAVVGRSYAGKVSQLVTGSIGFDDYEWGVTLYANDPIQFKKLIYEMRYDRASADYAEFGPFYVGIRIQDDRVGDLLARVVPKPGQE